MDAALLSLASFSGGLVFASCTAFAAARGQDWFYEALGTREEPARTRLMQLVDYARLATYAFALASLGCFVLGLFIGLDGLRDY